MMHVLPDEQLARFHEAFASWADVCDSTIAVRDLDKVLRFLGEPLSLDLHIILEDPTERARRISFNGFVDLIAGPPCYAVASDDEELMEAVAAYDDGNGYVALRDLMRAVDEHLTGIDGKLTDDQLRDIYLRALDVSLLQNAGGNMAPDMMRSIFAEEFAALRKETMPWSVEASAIGNEALPAANVESSGEDRLARLRQDASNPDNLINLSVVDLSGTHLLSHTVAPGSCVEELHQEIEKLLGVPVQRQTVFLAGETLPRKDVTLSGVGALDGMTLMLVVKEDFKVDYKPFIGKFMDAYFEHRSSA